MIASLLNGPTGQEEESEALPPQYILIMGDMNFRVSMDYGEAMKALDFVKQRNLRGSAFQTHLNTLLASDQLSKALRSNQNFRNLKEKLITFLPTFKLDEKSDNYSTEKQRTPSW
jgi:hypothetical protein